MNDTSVSSTGRASGRFVLRIEPDLHAVLRERAAAAGLSLNAYCAGVLAAPWAPLERPLAEAVQRAIALHGEAVVGVLVYGSWPRQELSTESDVDLLIVIDSGVPVSRALYRVWDELPPLHWESHSVEPHFVHLPDADGGITGTWAEAAVDGLVIFERDLAVSRRLAALRRRIADGAIKRRWAHGQPYWVEAA
ncbi:MAG TPA: toxin-antitoxin system HicB family antitoxin [Longimicrobiaceae bacterium]|nr:toxin-antitoxin system HicB family antitoxin [Longimicrobiaceae bacterium]